MTDNDKVYGQNVRGMCLHCGKPTRFDRTRYGRGVNFDLLHLESSQPRNYVNASQCTLCEGIVVWVQSKHGKQEVSDVRVVPLGGERPTPNGTPDIVAPVFRRAAKLSGIDSTASAVFLSGGVVAPGRCDHRGSLPHPGRGPPWLGESKFRIELPF